MSKSNPTLDPTSHSSPESAPAAATAKSVDGSVEGVGESSESSSVAFKAGFVALLGPPNAGKSSLLNRILGERLAIVSAKPQTTRSRILGILPRKDAQLLFLDTPGRHVSPKKLNEALNKVVEEVARDCDVACLLVDRTVGWTDVHDELAASLIAKKRPTLIVGTKCDLARAQANDWPVEAAPTQWPACTVSALTGEGVESLLTKIVRALPISPPLYGEDELTDRPMRWLCAEMIRESVFELLDKELPYSMAVEVLRYDESKPKLLKIGANLLVERDSQKRIVVGRGGSMVKKIGIRSRKSIEAWVGCRVHLELFVKVDPTWLKTGRRIQELGYQ
jgi:GTP-binding protein Era